MAELGSSPTGRCAALLGGAVVALVGTAHLVHAVPTTVGFGATLTWLAEWVLLGCCAWASLVAAALLVAARHGPDLLRWCCPRPWQPVALAAAGAAVAAGALAPAQAEGWHPPSLARPVDRPPLTAPIRGPANPAQAGPAPRATVAVRSGDSLWRIAARHHPGADDAVIAAAVDALYRLNRGVIGEDPDLLHPGVQLHQPPTWPVEGSPR